MRLLKEFIKEYNKSYIHECSFSIYKFYKDYKKLIPRDELEDFQQDIIIAILNTEKVWDASKGKFVTLLLFYLKKITNSIITKYTGITVSDFLYNKFVKDNCPIKITMIAYDDQKED